MPRLTGLSEAEFGEKAGLCPKLFDYARRQRVIMPGFGLKRCFGQISGMKVLHTP
jgi:hypothetical protein